MDKKKVIAICNNNNQLVGVIYPYEKGFIATEQRSSMGFTTIDGAWTWIAFCCREDRPMDLKFLPEWVREDIEKELLTKTEG